MLRHLVRHLVAFEDVGEGVEPKTERIGHVHQHVDLVLAVAVAGHEALLFEDLKQGFQFQIDPRRHRAAAFADVFPFGGAQGGAVLDLGLSIFTGTNEMVVIHLLHAHARLWKARPVTVAPVALLHVLPERELDERHGFLVQKVLRLGAPTEFDDGALTPDGVGGSVKDLGTRHAAGQLTVHVHVLAVHGVSNPDLGTARLRAFVHAAVHGDVRVLVDHARRHVLPAAIDFQWNHATRQQLGGVEVGADGDQGPIVEQHVRPFENAVRFTCPHRGIPNPHGLGRKPFRRAVGRKRVHHTRKVECWNIP